MERPRAGDRSRSHVNHTVEETHATAIDNIDRYTTSNTSACKRFSAGIAKDVQAAGTFLELSMP